MCGFFGPPCIYNYAVVGVSDVVLKVIYSVYGHPHQTSSSAADVDCDGLRLQVQSNSSVYIYVEPFDRITGDSAAECFVCESRGSDESRNSAANQSLVLCIAETNGRSMPGLCHRRRIVLMCRYTGSFTRYLVMHEMLHTKGHIARKVICTHIIGYIVSSRALRCIRL